MDMRADFSQMVSESACSMLNDPGAISEYLIAKALKRRQTLSECGIYLGGGCNGFGKMYTCSALCPPRS